MELKLFLLVSFVNCSRFCSRYSALLAISSALPVKFSVKEVPGRINPPGCNVSASFVPPLSSIILIPVIPRVDIFALTSVLIGIPCLIPIVTIILLISSLSISTPLTDPTLIPRYFTELPTSRPATDIFV